MVMKRLVALLICCVLTVASFAVGSGRGELSERQLRKYKALYLEAVCQREAGNVVAYYRLLERAIKVNPNGAEALFELAQLGLAYELPISVNDYLSRAHSLCPDNADYTYEYARFCFAMSDPRGVELMRSLLHNEQMRDNAYAELCGYYEMSNDYDHLCEVLEQWRPLCDNDELVSTQKLRSAISMGRYADALLIADTLSQANPSAHNHYLVMKGEALIGLSRYDEVLAICNQIADDDTESPGAQILLYKYALATKDKVAEEDALHRLIVNPLVVMPTRVAALRNYLNDLPASERKAKRGRLINELLPMPEETPTIYAYIIEQMQNENMPDSLMIPLYNKLLDINPSDELSRLHLMQNSLASQDYAELDRLSTDGLKENPTHPLFYYFAGAALQIAKKDSAAIDMFARGMKYINSDTHTELVSSYYSGYADALHKTGRKQEAYAMYDSALVYNGENVMCLNNYAYFLSLDNTRLDKALQMSAKTLEQSPDEPTYLDTYAWIEFLCGNYDSARKYMDRAIENSDMTDAENVSLADHAGDIYYHLGLTAEALNYWQLALKLNPADELIKKKVKNQKYYKE